MSYECIYCNFSAPTSSRLNRHLSTQKHVRNEFLYKEEEEKENVQEDAQQILNELVENIEETNKTEVLDKTDEKNIENEEVELCENIDCERYPPDWDFEEDTEETYQQGQWAKCSLCPGYFNDDGLGDVLFIEEEPNNQEASCNLCGKTQNIVQMKGTGQYLCGNACDESENEEESVQEEEEEEDNIPEEAEQIIDQLIENVQDFLKKQTKEDVQDLEYEILDNKDGFECDDCNKIGIDCFENIGLSKNAADIYMDFGEPDRCEDCYDKWLLTEDAEEYLNKINEKIDYDFDEFLNPLILDIQTIVMIKNINEILTTTHPFILQTVNIFMNIVKWFSFPTAPFDVKLSPDYHRGIIRGRSPLIQK